MKQRCLKLLGMAPLLFLSALMNLSAHAAPPAFHVQVLDSNLSSEGFQRSGVAVERKNISGRLSVTEIESLISAAALEEEALAWDNLAKDLLAIRSRTFTLEKLSAQYPDIPQEKLGKFKGLVIGANK